MKKFSLLIIVLLFFCAGTAYAEEQSPLPFTSGEEIVYAIKKLGIKVGEATLVFDGKRKIEGQDFYLITFTAKALNFLDEEKIYVDPVTFKPVIVERNLNIFGKKERIVEKYNAAKGLVNITKKVGGKKTEQVIERNQPIDNIYCFIYRYRHQGNFFVGDSLAITLPTQDVVIDLKEKKEIKLAGKTYDSYFMKSNPSKYKIWFDSSTKKIPLRIDGAVGFGSTSMIMQEYSNE